MIVGVVAVAAIIRFVMPPLADATNSLSSSGDALNADIDNVIAVGAVTMPDGASVDVWAKNVGAREISEIELMRVEFGRESNPLPLPYGGAGCTAPCWWYELEAPSWASGETLTLHIELSSAAESGALYRVRVSGHRGGHASMAVRAP